MLRLAGRDEPCPDPAELGWLGGASVFSVAGLEGAVGGGATAVALACDLTVMDAAATLQVPARSAGLAEALAARVGVFHALDLSATGRAVAAGEALTLGLADRVAPAGTLTQVLDALVADVLRTPREDLAETKALLRPDPGSGSAERARQALDRLAAGPEQEDTWT